MYSLDINFLKDRPDYRPLEQRTTPARQPGNMTPLIVGVAVGLLLPGLVGGLWFFLQQRTAQLETRKTELENQLASLQAERQKVTKLQQEIDQVNADTQSLASVFNQIKPWSAMLQDIRERVPAGVQIQNIEQKEDAAAAAAPAPSPSPSPSPNAQATPAKGANAPAANTPSVPTKLEITGLARSFDEVNYFLLSLQRSSFLKSNETQLVSAELVKNPSKLEVNVPTNRAQQSGSTVTYELPKSVQYKIQTTQSDVPASELLRELDRKGAVGLVTRIRTLQEKGVIQP